MKLDKRDRSILSELQRDSRLTMQELADRVGTSSSACWRRVKALEEAGTTMIGVPHMGSILIRLAVHL